MVSSSSLDDSTEEDGEMTAEISLMADKEDKMLTVQCSLVSDDLFTIHKFMQFDVQCKFIINISRKLNVKFKLLLDTLYN